MKIFEALRKDHDIQRKLIDELVETTGDSEKRKRLFYQLKHELEIHADAEERYFYIPLIKDNQSQEEARHGVAEHHEMDELLEEMDRTPFDSPQWLPIAKKLQHKVHHHLEDEEKTFFQIAGKVLEEKQKSNLGEEYIQAIDSRRVVAMEA